MDDERDKDFLSAIADTVVELVANAANMEHFRQQLRAFHKKLKTRSATIQQHRKKAEANPRLRNKEAGPPKRGWVWEQGTWFYKGFWRPPDAELPPNPLNWFLPRSDYPSVPQPTSAEALPNHYVSLSIIHDQQLPSLTFESISKDIWPEDEEWAKLLWMDITERDAMTVMNFRKDLRREVRGALANVKADLQKLNRKSRGRGGELSKASIAMAILFQEPEISPTELATRVGVSRGTLYGNSPAWRDVAKTLRARPKGRIPKGTKDADGNIEAESPHSRYSEDTAQE